MHFRRLIILILVLILWISQLWAQNGITILPSIGVQSFFCQLGQRNFSQENKNFTINNFNTSAFYGISIRVPVNNKISLNLGVEHAILGMSFSITIPDSLLKGPVRKSPKSGLTIASTLNRYKVGLVYEFTKFKHTKDIENKKHNITGFRNRILIPSFQLMGGLTLDNLRPYTGEGTIQEGGFSSNFGNQIYYSWVSKRLINYSASIYFGGTFKLSFKEKRSVQLGMTYHQGLVRSSMFNLHYTVNGLESNTVLYSRGSTFVVEISYPFYIIKYKNEK